MHEVRGVPTGQFAPFLNAALALSVICVSVRISHCNVSVAEAGCLSEMLMLVLMLMLSRHPNVLILTTSNITGVIDVAFLDRADVRQYIGLPSAAAVYQILYSCIQELIRVCHCYMKHLVHSWQCTANTHHVSVNSSQHTDCSVG